MMFATYFAVALVAGQLTARIRAQGRHERLREERAMALLHLTKSLSAARSLTTACTLRCGRRDKLFAAQSSLLLGHFRRQRTVSHSASSYTLPEKERGVADWAWRNRKRAGRFTETLPSAEGFHIPLVREDTALGVLSIRVPPRRPSRSRSAISPKALRRNLPCSWRASSSGRRQSAKSFSPNPRNFIARCSTAYRTS
jgi:two-component system sensor histidine kinase KdpD